MAKSAVWKIRFISLVMFLPLYVGLSGFVEFVTGVKFSLVWATFGFIIWYLMPKVDLWAEKFYFKFRWGRYFG